MQNDDSFELVEKEINPWPLLKFSFEASRDALCYSECSSQEKLELTVFLENETEIPCKKFRINVRTSADMLQGVESWIISGNVNGINHSKNTYSTTASFSLNPVMFRGLTEENSETITAELFDDTGNLVQSRSISISIMPMDYWSGSPVTLPFFIERNNPEILSMHKLVSNALFEIAGTTSLDAYQSNDAGLVLSQCAAIYSVLQGQKLFYEEPKQGDFYSGQRIRLVSEILREKSATCLDSTLLFCALAESIGLHPLVCCTYGHSFAGVWLYGDKMFDSIVHDDPSDIIALSESLNQKICIVETTCLTTTPYVPFQIACDKARKEAIEAESLRIVDVNFGRKIRIAPIPRQIVTPDGEIVLEDDPAFAHFNNTPGNISSYDLGEVTSADNGPKTRIDQWERRLLSTSTRSALLNAKVKSTSVLILHPELESLEDSLQNGKKFSLLANPYTNVTFKLQDDSSIKNYSDIFLQKAADHKLFTGEDEKNLLKKLRQISRKAQAEQSETGVNPLFLSLGHIEWTDKDDAMAYCAPILLYPVSLANKSKNEFVLTLRDGEEPQLNYSIFEKMANEFSINTSLDYERLPSDGHGLDIRRIFQLVKHDIERMPKWRVCESCLLGLFSFDQFVMWNDIHKHSELLRKNKVVYSLVEGEMQDQDGSLPEVEDDDFIQETVPVSCDESQMKAVKAAGQGRSFILQGPPGTGKSQTITAMIVNALAKGKKVLFVAEKMAALQVVYRNLSKVNCNEYLLEMHSTKISKSHLVEQLSKALERHSMAKKNLDTLESGIKNINSELAEYVKVLHSKTDCGLSLYELINMYESSRGKDDCQLQLKDIEGVSMEALEKCFFQLRDLSRNLSKFHPVEDSPFRFFGFMDLDVEQQNVISSSIESFQKALLGMLSTIDSLFSDKGKVASSIQFSFIKEVDGFLVALKEIKEKHVQADFLTADASRISNAVEAIRSYQNTRKSYVEKVGKEWNPAIFSVDIPALLREWDSLKGGLFKGKKRREFVSRISSYSASPINENEVELSLRKLNSAGISSVDLQEALNSVPFEFRTKYIDDDPDLILDSLRVCQAYKDATERFLCSVFESEVTKETVQAYALKCFESPSVVDGLRDCMQNVVSEWNGLMALLAPTEELGDCTIHQILEMSEYWIRHLNDFFEWGKCNRLRSYFDDKPYAKMYVERIANGEKPNEVIDNLKASFVRSQIERIILQTPSLKRYVSEDFFGMIDELESLEAQYRKEVVLNVHSILDLIIAEREQNQTQRRLLTNFITSGGKRQSIRSLFNSCYDLITDICPCLLMSPMSVSQYLSAGNQVFDLVIFDEASQIQTCKAVGAIARGKDLIVVGDSKQMPPTSFFSKSFDGNEEVSADKVSLLDMDSILDDCINIEMPQLRLSWHYRSTNESLIHFSNTHYYNNNLKTYPSVDSMVSKVRLRKVRGYYQPDNKEGPNPAEAEAIISEIMSRLQDPIRCKDSIGVITFNEKQQSLILKLLDSRFEKDRELARRAHWDENEIDCPDKLIVKNLENIQGDERDVILLSVTFGRTQSGRFSKNFGPISNAGGEKRLNVAFSRAKKEMLVFSVIDVVEFSGVELTSRGANDLRSFLKYAASQSIPEREGQGASLIREKISAALNEKGYETDINIGLSEFKIDIAIRFPESDEYFCGILLDGENLTTATLSNDRFVLRKTMLGIRGWKIIQIRTIDWYCDRDAVLSELLERVEQFLNATKEEKQREPLIEDLDSSFAEGEIETSFAGEYVICELPYDQIKPNDFLNIEPEFIMKKIEQVIEKEGPILDDLLEMRVVSSYGIKKRGSNIRKYLDDILFSMDTVRTEQVDIAGKSHSVFWPESYRDFGNSIEEKFILFRNPPLDSSELNSVKRSISEYPQVEIRNAMAMHIRNLGPTLQVNLLREISNKLGFKRSGSEITETLELVLKNALSSGFFDLGSDGGIALSTSK